MDGEQGDRSVDQREDKGLLVPARGTRRDQISPGNLNFDPAALFNHHLLSLSDVLFRLEECIQVQSTLVAVLGLGHDVMSFLRIVPGVSIF
jgi:hypothetical protein